ncbi:MAG: GTP 3',8-cyclase MoaA [Anaerolineaceae bacterium]|nr:GTP 3',8-cyclase MoaA [Anaerolineaceae bacterium]
MLTDSFGRQITYLRVSVTDRCNMRCVYCMPPEGIHLHTHDETLRYEEILKIVQAAAQHGVTEVRLTGGEPLARAGITSLVRMIAETSGITDLSLTTNGLLLEKYASELAKAGLKRVNISIDTLNPEKFARITRGASLERVWGGLNAAEAAGLSPIKLNTVAMKGVNDDELFNIACLSQVHPWRVRFIELMPVNNQVPWGEGFPNPQSAYLPISKIRKILAPLDLQPVEEKSGSGPAREYRIPGAPGTIGFISPLGEHFCESCNRLRLTADGALRPCLLSDIEIPILKALRAGEDIYPYLQKAVSMKPEGHDWVKNHRPMTRCMIQIGG